MKRLLAVAALLSLSACFSLTVRHGNRVPEAGAARERWVHTFFGGTWQPGGPVQVEELCPQGVASIHQEVSFVNWAVTQLSGVPASAVTGAVQPVYAPVAYATVGRHLEVWSPWTLAVLCAKGSVTAKKYAVVGLVARGGISPDTVSLFTDALVAELRRQPGSTVLTDQDISAAIGLERQKQLLGCTENSACLAEIGGALGVDRLIHGSVGRVGGSLVVTLTSLDPDNTRIVASVSERLKSGSDEAFLDALPGMVQQLFVEAIAR